MITGDQIQEALEQMVREKYFYFQRGTIDGSVDLDRLAELLNEKTGEEQS